MRVIFKNLLFLGFISMFSSCGPTGKLPIYGDRSPMTRIINGKTVIDTLYKTIPHFSYLDQDSNLIENKNLLGKIYVADFFFTSCPTICPIMQKNMVKLSNVYAQDEDIYFVSYSIDPTHDTVQKLKKYANQLGISGKHWYLLTGNRDSTYKLAEKGYFATAKSDSTAPGGIVHSGGLILVDKLQRIRGIYDGTLDDEVEKLKGDLKILKAEK